jgi:hypothetical protein
MADACRVARRGGVSLGAVLGWVDLNLVADMRPFTIEIPCEEVTTKDGVPVPVVLSARIHAHVVGPKEAASRVVDFREATLHIARAAVRKTFRGHTLEEWRLGRTRTETAGQEATGAVTTGWGVRVPTVEIEVAALTSEA